MNRRVIENTHKLLITNSKRHPAIILSQVNMMADYLEKVREGYFEGLRTDELNTLEDLISNVCFVMGFQRPEGQWYGHYLLHNDPDLNVKTKKGSSK